MKSSRLPTQSGATLIEVMVSALIVSFGVLAMIALQANAVRYSKTSEYRAMASLLANDLGDRMRINRNAALDGRYDLTADYTSPTSVPERAECANPNNCSPEELAVRDLGEWRRSLYFALPGGSGYVEAHNTGGDGVVDVWVAWLDPAEANPSSSANGATGECPAKFAGKSPQPRCAFFRVAMPPKALPQ